MRKISGASLTSVVIALIGILGGWKIVTKNRSTTITGSNSLTGSPSGNAIRIEGTNAVSIGGSQAISSVQDSPPILAAPNGTGHVSAVSVKTIGDAAHLGNITVQASNSPISVNQSGGVVAGEYNVHNHVETDNLATKSQIDEVLKGQKAFRELVENKDLKARLDARFPIGYVLFHSAGRRLENSSTPSGSFDFNRKESKVIGITPDVVAVSIVGISTRNVHDIDVTLEVPRNGDTYRSFKFSGVVLEAEIVQDDSTGVSFVIGVAEE